jgi:alkanesulfonate monooxygenase
MAQSAFRYRRSHEVVEVLRQAWTRDTIDFAGEVCQFKGVPTDPARRLCCTNRLMTEVTLSPDGLIPRLQ